MRTWLGILGVAVGSGVMVPPGAHATCTPDINLGNFVSQSTLASGSFGTSLPTAAAADRLLRDPSSLDGKTYVAKGTYLLAIWDDERTTAPAHTAGSVAWSVNTTTQIHTSPVVYPVSGTGALRVVIVTGSTLRVYDAESGAQLASYAFNQTGCSDISTKWAISVQLRDYSNATYTATYNLPDRIFLGTRRTGCTNSATQNQVLAFHLSGSSLIKAWESATTLALNTIEGCLLDYGTNAIVCAASSDGTNPNTLVRFQTTASGVGGGVTWAVNRGRLSGIPYLVGNNLFTGQYFGTIQVSNFANGTLAQALPLTTTATMPNTIFVDSRIAGGYQNTIMALTSDGLMHGVKYNSSTNALTRLWSPQGGTQYTVSDTPYPDPTLEMFYAPTIGGQVEQRLLTTGALNMALDLGYTGTVVRPTYWAADPAERADTMAALVHVTGGTTYRKVFCTPIPGDAGMCIPNPGGGGWIPVPPGGGSTRSGEDSAYEGSAPLAAGSDTGGGGRAADPLTCPTSPCAVPPECSGGACLLTKKDDGTACTPSCGSGGQCWAGACVPTNQTGCPCSEVGGSSCGYGVTGMACCGSTRGCQNLLTAWNNCGACGQACGNPAGTSASCGGGICNGDLCSVDTDCSTRHGGTQWKCRSISGTNRCVDALNDRLSCGTGAPMSCANVCVGGGCTTCSTSNPTLGNEQCARQYGPGYYCSGGTCQVSCSPSCG